MIKRAAAVIAFAYCAAGNWQTVYAEDVFRAMLTTDQVVPVNLNPVGADAAGIATLVYDPVAQTLSYDLELIGADTKLEDVLAIHIHDAPVGSSGPHRLNVLGSPGEAFGDNDNDVVVNLASNSLIGKWDDGDVTHEPPYNPLETHRLSDYVDALFAETLYFQVHTVAFPTPEGVLRGQILFVPEPSTSTLLLIGLLAVCRRRQIGRTAR